MKTLLTSLFIILPINCLYSQNSAETHVANGMRLFQNDNYEAAIEECEKAIKINPDFDNAYYCRACARAMKKDFNGALRDCDKVILLNSYHAGAYYIRGFAYFGLNEIRKAIKELDKAISINPDYTEALLIRGICKMNIHEKEGACSDWTRATKLGNKLSLKYKNDYCK